MQNKDAVVLVDGARTPMGSFQGVFKSVTAVELAAIAVKEAIQRSALSPDDIQEVIMGCVLPAGLKQGPARQASLQAGIPASTGCTTINKLCGSGMKAVMLAHDLISAGTNTIMLAGGMESMSNAPFLLEKARQGYRMGHQQVLDHMFTDGLEDAETGKLMGWFAQHTADEHELSREAMDQFAITSLQRANDAIQTNKLSAEIVPVPVQTRKQTTLIQTDEQPGQANIEKIPSLKPAFAQHGTITAANSSSISDGASALVLMSESEAIQRGFKPKARIVAHSTHSQHPSTFTTAPVSAIKKVLDKAQWQKDDVDLFEINEAFAMVTMIAMQSLDLPHEKVNVHGGACAQGHPVGSTGSRILITLMYALEHYNLQRGIASLCIGGGEATAVAIERIS
ncbi:thiolase family protein [Zooshikella harenae]|uniref:Thiolase family protein n=1 Tax=Zooshikella harenae TaxID=2827238 RepID=A0ABS5ZBA1_9GAMM|nr:thiolase family protein [Zooshikella harenae]MBU2710187.1 thiolase family protein [Zooshikella harenae]